MGRYDGFELAADKWLTEVVSVYRVSTTIGQGGAQQGGRERVITGLKASVQPRSAFASHTVLGWLPEQTHTMFCKALDENAVRLDIKLGYEVEDAAGRLWRVIGPPESFIDPATRKEHHLEIALKAAVKL